MKYKGYRADFDAFYNYICELVRTYRSTKDLRGISQLAKKHKVKTISKIQFFNNKLHETNNQEIFDKNGMPKREYVDNIRKELIVIDKDRYIKRQEVAFFGNNMPGGYDSIVTLEPTLSMKWRYALPVQAAIDNATEYMLSCAISKFDALEELEHQLGIDYAAEYLEYQVPTLCCSEELGCYHIGFIKSCNNGSSFWLAENKDVLRLLAWTAYIVERKQRQNYEK